VQPELTVVCRFQSDGEFLDSSIVATHWLKLSSEKPTCWYPPQRWQNKPGQFRILPHENGPGQWFEVSEGHVHVDEISTLLHREAHQWLENVCTGMRCLLLTFNKLGLFCRFCVKDVNFWPMQSAAMQLYWFIHI